MHFFHANDFCFYEAEFSTLLFVIKKTKSVFHTIKKKKGKKEKLIPIMPRRPTGKKLNKKVQSAATTEQTEHLENNSNNNSPVPFVAEDGDDSVKNNFEEAE